MNGVPAVLVGFGLLNLAQQGQGQRLVLNEARIRAVRSCRASASRSGGGGRRRSRGQVDAGLLQAPGTLDLVRVWSVKVYNGSERPVVCQRRGNGAAAVLPAAASGQNPGAGELRGRGSELVGGPGARDGAPAGVLGGCGAAERRGHGSAGVRCGGARQAAL